MRIHRLPSFSSCRPIVASLAFLGALTIGTEARAGVEACGNIHVEANANCEVLVEGGCEAQCVPPRLEAACAAELTASCEGQCNELPSVECTGSCQADCDAQCIVDPGSIDCRARCEGSCEANCDAECGTDSECHASCEANCSGSCESSCQVAPPEATCEARCEAACEGSCEANTNLDCQIDCQAEGYVECKARLEGGCETACTRPEGALFCDGQYVDHGGNLEECITALQARYGIEVEGYAEGSCQPGRCEGEAGGSVSCSVGRGGAGFIPFALMIALFGAVRRRTTG